ncbi:MAG: hypothetical protein Q9220_002036 [cf. Caloplaca sp. 1 TL-2023]
MQTIESDVEPTGQRTASFAIVKAVTIKKVFEPDYTWEITEPAIMTIAHSAEHYLGIIIASMPALRPIFTKVLDSTAPSQDSSRRSFQKVRSATAAMPTPGSYVPSSRNSIQQNYIKRTTDFRVCSQLELQVGLDYEMAHTHDSVRGLRRESNSWASTAFDSERMSRPGTPRGGYMHVHDASRLKSDS